MAGSAFVRVRRWRAIWAAVAGALGMVSVPAVAGAQPAPYAPPPTYAPPTYPAPQPGQPPGQTGQWQPPAQPYVPPAGRSSKIVNDVFPIVRVSPGVGIHFDQADSGLTSFDLDVTGGVGLNIWSRSSITSDLAVEATYTFSSEPKMGGHFAGIGVTPMLHFNEFVGVGWAPKFVGGGTWQGLAVGMRNMLVIPVFFDMFQLEAGHQWLRVVGLGQDQHELRILGSVDLMRPLILLSAGLRGYGTL